jgi:hypothetical protein
MKGTTDAVTIKNPVSVNPTKPEEIDKKPVVEP